MHLRQQCCQGTQAADDYQRVIRFGFVSRIKHITNRRANAQDAANKKRANREAHHNSNVLKKLVAISQSITKYAKCTKRIHDSEK